MEKSDRKIQQCRRAPPNMNFEYSDDAKRKICNNCKNIPGYIGETLAHFCEHNCEKVQGTVKSTKLATKLYEEYTDTNLVKRKMCLKCKGTRIKGKLYIGETVANWYKHRCPETINILAAPKEATYDLLCKNCHNEMPITLLDIERAKKHPNVEIEQIKNGAVFECSKCPRLIRREQDKLMCYEEELTKIETKPTNHSLECSSCDACDMSVEIHPDYKLKDSVLESTDNKILAEAFRNYGSDEYFDRVHKCQGYCSCAIFNCPKCEAENILLKENALEYAKCTDKTIEKIETLGKKYLYGYYILHCLKCKEALLIDNDEINFNKRIKNTIEEKGDIIYH